jgi:hypothetical protein
LTGLTGSSGASGLSPNKLQPEINMAIKPIKKYSRMETRKSKKTDTANQSIDHKKTGNAGKEELAWGSINAKRAGRRG